MKIYSPLIIVAVSVVAVGVGFYFGYNANDGIVERVNELRSASFLNGQLTNPLLECIEPSTELSIGERAKIESAVQVFTKTSLNEGKITEAAVYFRDLNNGPWFGINEREKFVPGSLLKLPLAISYYWRSQFEKDLLDQKIDFSGNPVRLAIEAEYASDTILNPGVYSIQDLLNTMLRESNNDAAEILAEYAGLEEVQRTYKDFGIEPPTFGNDYAIDVKTFGAFFRVLFNASYVGQPASESILATLTQSTFRSGLVAGVPEQVKVAHKFGTRVTNEPNGKQLHDCGIVYAPRTPYVLCVMTRGNSFKELEYFIQQVSKRVYAGVIE